MWGVPFRLFLVATALGIVTPLVDRLLALDLAPFPHMDAATVASILGTIAGAMMTLSGLVFTALSAAMSFGVTSLSVRIVPVFQQDTVLRWGLGLFVGTFVYALLVALSIAIGEGSDTPWVATAIAAAATVGCGVMFIAVAVRVCEILNPAILLRRLSRAGFRAMRFQPSRFHSAAAAVSVRRATNRHVVRRTTPLRHGDTLLAVHTHRIVALEHEWGVRIELVADVGTAVQYGAVVFRTSDELSSSRASQLLGTLAFGDTYSPDSGPFGALRSMSDIALKALSPAVNDPTRAVQALDQIEDLLATLSPTLAAERDALRGDPDASLIRSWSRTWDDYVVAATDEIRQFGTTSVQVQRRLRALLESLIAQCPREQHPPLRARLAALDRGRRRWWRDPLDRRAAAGSDPQGLGAEQAAITGILRRVIGRADR